MAEALPAARNGMRISRRFLALDGTALNLDQLKQNTEFVVLLEGEAQTREGHRALAMQGLPAGWEITARLPAGAVPGMPWLGELTPTEAQPAADDRFAAALELTEQKQGFRVAVRVRAVTPGFFELPGAEMFRFMAWSRWSFPTATIGRDSSRCHRAAVRLQHSAAR